jgi:hypothetical protein
LIGSLNWIIDHWERDSHLGESLFLLFILSSVQGHVIDGPQMAVQVYEAPVIHEAVIFRFRVHSPAQGECGIHDLIDFFSAFEGQGDRHLCIFARIDRFLFRERIEK